MENNRNLAIQNQFNQEEFNSWNLETNYLQDKTKGQYISATTRFLLFIKEKSILEIDRKLILSFRNSPIGLKNKSDLKPSTQRARINYLSNFLTYVYKRNTKNVKWDFSLEEFPSFVPPQNEIDETQENAEALAFKDFISIYKQFNKKIDSDKEWLLSYVIFRLMFNFNLDKYDIANINKNNYDLKTGLFHLPKTSHYVQFDKEIISIIQKEGLRFLAYSPDTIYLKLEKLDHLLRKKVTQEVIRRTKQKFLIQCPYCGEYFENNSSNFGLVKINILNLNGILVCNSCIKHNENNIRSL